MNEYIYKSFSDKFDSQKLRHDLLIPRRTAYGIPYKNRFFVRNSVKLDPFTNPLKNILVNRLSTHELRKLQRFQQQFQASKSAVAHEN